MPSWCHEPSDPTLYWRLILIGLEIHTAIPKLAEFASFFFTLAYRSCPSSGLLVSEHDGDLAARNMQCGHCREKQT